MDDRSKRFQELLKNKQKKTEKVQKRQSKQKKVSDIFYDMEQERRKKLVAVWEDVLGVLCETEESVPHILTSFLTAYDDFDFKTLKFENKERRLEFIEFQLSKWIKSGQEIPIDLLVAYAVHAKSQNASETKGTVFLRKELHEQELKFSKMQTKIKKLQTRSQELNNLIDREEKRIHKEIRILEGQFSYFSRWSNDFKDRMAVIEEAQNKLEAEEKYELLTVDNEITSLETELIFHQEKLTKLKTDLSQLDTGADEYGFWFEPVGLEPINGVPLEMIKVPSGKHWRGSYDHPEERPIANIRLGYSFEILSTPVTQGLYIAVLGENPSTNRGLLKPVERVSWHDAIRFCNALSVIYGFETAYRINKTTGNVRYVPSSDGFRLPTEFEWEVAARASQSHDFAGSDDANLVAWTMPNARNKTKNTRRRKPNAWGLYDMSGNVWEWCWDWYAPNYYQKSPKEDPMGPSEGTKRSMRGGSVSSGPDRARVSSRAGAPPHAVDSFLGFRVVRTPRTKG